ncbi:MAG: hypothetical protein ACLSB9_24345 [Hydrogeniiclostridium mannosilyticum]
MIRGYINATAAAAVIATDTSILPTGGIIGDDAAVHCKLCMDILLPGIYITIGLVCIFK